MAEEQEFLGFEFRPGNTTKDARQIAALTSLARAVGQALHAIQQPSPDCACTGEHACPHHTYAVEQLQTALGALQHAAQSLKPKP